MGNTVWVLSEGKNDDNWDHSLILDASEDLDALATELGVDKLSDFYDYSILQEEYGVESEPMLFDAEALDSTLLKLHKAIDTGQSPKLKNNSELVEELEDCIKKVQAAKTSGLKVRLAIVP